MEWIAWTVNHKHPGVLFKQFGLYERIHTDSHNINELQFGLV